MHISSTPAPDAARHRRRLALAALALLAALATVPLSTGTPHDVPRPGEQVAVADR